VKKANPRDLLQDTTWVAQIVSARFSHTLGDANMDVLPKRLLHGLAVFGVLATAPFLAAAYTPDNHQLSIAEGAALCERQFGIRLSSVTMEGMVDGVLEPDRVTPSSIQMLLQRIEQGSYGQQRNVSLARIAAQSLHGSPNPTRPVYTDSKEDRGALGETIARDPADLSPDRYPIDVYSYDTNMAVRNKMLINASQFLCVSLAQSDAEQAAQRFGNMMHMIGDTYSASHVQRSPPTGANGDCGTEQIEWHFSMDLVSWKQHAPADEDAEDWRFACLVEHTSELMRLWAYGRQAVQATATAQDRIAESQTQVRQSMLYLCQSVFREDEAVLRRPAGGAAAEFSSASGDDNWAVLQDSRRDRAIEPVGLTSTAEARAFHVDVAARLRRRGSPAQYSYPSRDMTDLCAALTTQAAMPEPLRCTANEIGWAMSADDSVSSMWIPARPLP
jgi:hypothetical protein